MKQDADKKVVNLSSKVIEVKTKESLKMASNSTKIAIKGDEVKSKETLKIKRELGTQAVNKPKILTS